MAAGVLIAVIAATAAVTLSVAGNRNNQPPPEAAPSTVVGEVDSDIASASDTGPVAIITDDPTCPAQRPIVSTLAAKTNAGWDKREPAVPATQWTPEVRAQHEAVAQAMRTAADQFVQLAEITPHRVMREIYEQFSAYARAYAASVPTYTPVADHFARFAVAAAEAISRICAAIEYGSAATRAPLVEEQLETPANVAPTGDPSAPERFLPEPNAVCDDWNTALMQFQDETANWRNADPNIPAGEWTPEQERLNAEVAPVMRRFATQLRALGRESGNLVFADFANLSAQYRTALEKALPTYVPADDYLAGASARLNQMVNSACQAAEE
ncbi:hypothetical protein [Mycolicibacterium goodii]|uniref:Uncharacterized protein n=1 Tax=Mycolicibacterium goodii TaxID=134601 RepID=A0ABS6HYJ2_MYCGD|nr:hypothetical protein [Mycolicibacterium goodii]MBU8814328.1 hypothetical protein [Mycolicibacterium goodii]MBU8827731.1 hypothetical protein [Mycolicibacterium goodii]MBU8841393.1 hypothetical protein [Mycolicibacterium goodii]